MTPIAWKVSKYGVFSAPYFPVFGQNTRKYGPEKTPYLDTFHVVIDIDAIKYPYLKQIPQRNQQAKVLKYFESFFDKSAFASYK